MSKNQIAFPVAAAVISHSIETTHDHPSGIATARRSATDMGALLHPARTFDQPDGVVNNPTLTRDEKRAILASWASDACAVEAAPALRRPPGSTRVVKVDEILEALRTLDKLAGERGASWTTRQVRRVSIEAFRESRTRWRSREGRSLH